MENHGQKRSAEEQNDLLGGVKVILLDIEGTTAPISFTKTKLFPYVRDNIKGHLEGHWEEEELQADVDAIRAQVAADKEAGVEGVVDIPDKDASQADIITAVVNNVVAQMDRDRKTTCLKQLQGHMWREGYKTGKFQAEVFDDVVPALKQWLKSGVKVYIDSSGSEEAQKLFFGYSDKGDLTEFIAGYFDTTIGAKVDKDRYTKIAETCGVPGEDILVLTDLTPEAKVAAEAGLRTCIVVREGNAPLSESDIQRFNAVTSFSELFLSGDEDPASKRLEGEDDDEDDEDDPDDVDDLDDEGDLDGEDPEEGEGEGEED